MQFIPTKSAGLSGKPGSKPDAGHEAITPRDTGHGPIPSGGKIESSAGRPTASPAGSGLGSAHGAGHGNSFGSSHGVGGANGAAGSPGGAASNNAAGSGERIRVLVVDDSIVYRKAISDVLKNDPAIEVVGQAADGEIALSKIESLKPHLITLDIEMPNRDGLGTLRALQKMPRPPKVIMVSTLSSHGALVTIEALALGAADYITKPTNLGSSASNMANMREELIPKIRQFFPRISERYTSDSHGTERAAYIRPHLDRTTGERGPGHGSHGTAGSTFHHHAPAPSSDPGRFGATNRSGATSAPGLNRTERTVGAPQAHHGLPDRTALPNRRTSGAASNAGSAASTGASAGSRQLAALAGSVRRLASVRPKVLLIGVSTGGPNALAELVPHLPADFPVPVLITQHMPPIFTRLLAERLNAQSQIRVHEAEEGMQILPGHAYLAPGNFHLGLRKEDNGIFAALNQEPQENSCRPAVDHMFRHAKEIYGGACLAVILTGMGMDGLRGCRELKELGATVITQDEASSVVWGMPGFVTREGLSDAVLDLTHIAPEIIRRF